MIARAFTTFLVSGLMLALAWWWPRATRPPDPFELGLRLLSQGRALDAIYVMDEPIWQGIAHFRAGHYLHAAHAFADDGSILAQYNLGTSYAHAQLWDVAILAFEEVLRRDPDNGDASHNLEIVRRAQALEEELIQAQREASAIKAGEVHGDGTSGDSDNESGASNDEAPGKNLQPTARHTAGLAIDNAPPGEIGEPAQDLEHTAGHTRAAETEGQAVDEQPAIAHPPAASDINAPRSAEAFLQAIADDPARVLQSRLRIAHQQRLEGQN